MRKIVATLLATAALSFGGAAVANAEPAGVPTAPVATSTTVAQSDTANNDDDSDKTGLWGLTGLLGLLGLLGLRRRPDVDRGVGTTGTTTATGGAPGPRL
jgi:MYXO-CTERM domain-containing protein